MSKKPRSKDPRWLYVVKGLSIRRIARELKGEPGCSRAALEERSSREKWVEQRAAYQAEVAKRAAEKAASKAREVPAPAPQPEGQESPATEGAVSGEAGQASPAAAPSAPPPPPPVVLAPVSWDRRMDAAIAQAADEMAESHAKDIVELAQGRRDAINAARMAITEARMWLVAHRSKMEVTREGEGGELQATIRTRKVKFQQRMAATGMLAQGAAVLRSMMVTDPIVGAQKDVHQMRELQARVEFLEMRVAGTLPPAKVEMEFQAQFAGLLSQLEKALPAEEYAGVLAAMEKTLGEGEEPAGGPVQH